MKKQTILVLGATGNLGAYSAVELKRIGHNIIASGRRKCDNGFFESMGIPYYSIDITNPKDFEKLYNEDIDVILNLAGELPSRNKFNPQSLIRTITESTLNILEFMRYKDIKKIIFPTTPYDTFYLHESGNPIESDALRNYPLVGDHSVYAIAKNAAVDLINHYHYEYGISRFIFRFFTIYQYHPNSYHYADKEMRKMPYRKLIDQAISGDTITIYGNPKRVKELVYIKDFTQAIAKSVESELPGGIYNIGAKERITLEDMIKGIIEVFSKNGKKSDIKYDYNKPDTLQSMLDITKTQQELGYYPKYSYIEMLKDMKKEMKEEPFAKLWGTKEYYDNIFNKLNKQ